MLNPYVEFDESYVNMTPSLNAETVLIMAGLNGRGLIDGDWGALHQEQSNLQTTLRKAITIHSNLNSTRPMNGWESVAKIVKDIESDLFERVEYDRAAHLFSEEAWDLSLLNPHLLYVGHNIWLVCNQAVRSSLNAYGENTIAPPILVYHSPPMHMDPMVGMVVYPEVPVTRPRGSDEYEPKTINISMVGSVGDLVHNDSTSWELLKEPSAIANPNALTHDKWPSEYLVAGIATALHFASVNGELDAGSQQGMAVLEQYIPTYRDKRTPIVIDKTRGGPAVWHDEVRCGKCNGRVLLKLPRGNQLVSITCPHSQNASVASASDSPPTPVHELTFPHLLDNRTFEEGGDSLKNVPKEAQ